MSLVKMLSKVTSKVAFSLRQMLAEGVNKLEALVGVPNAEDDAADSTTALYFVSFMLLILLVFLSPDKIPQVLAPTQIDSGMLGKVHDVMRLFRKLIPI